LQILLKNSFKNILLANLGHDIVSVLFVLISIILILYLIVCISMYFSISF